MRLPISVLILLATSAAALADETYPLPAVGSQLTYRLIATVKVLDRSLTIITGQVYTYTVTAVRGPVMEATITPVAMIYGCAADNTTKDCSFAAKAAELPAITRVSSPAGNAPQLTPTLPQHLYTDAVARRQRPKIRRTRRHRLFL